jgi:ComF family protein
MCGACLGEPPPYARTLASVDYDHPWDGLIAHFKFHGALDLAPALATHMLDTLERSDSPAPALLLPVPSSAQRLRERGYNQAWELARRLARALRCEADTRLLLRVMDTPHQLAFPPEQRANNVRGAFAVEPRRLDEISGRSVTVVDDVMTSGATVAEIARVLLQAGAREVAVWVFARTPRPEDA